MPPDPTSPDPTSRDPASTAPDAGAHTAASLVFRHGPDDAPLADRVWSLPAGARVELLPGVYRLPVALPHDIELVATKGLGSVTFEAPGGGGLSLEGAHRVRLVGLVLRGIERGSGALLTVYNPAEVDVVQCLFAGGRGAGTGGGAIDQQQGLVRVDRCRFSQNTALRGGAVRADGAVRLEVRNSVFHANVAERAGGALFVGGAASVEVVGCTFAANTAPLGTDVLVAATSTTPGRARIANSLFAAPGPSVATEGLGELALDHCVLPHLPTGAGLTLGPGLVERRLDVDPTSAPPFRAKAPGLARGLADPALWQPGEVDLHGQPRTAQSVGAVD